MRSQTRLPEGFAMYPQLLREQGYYCSNNSKEDYNLEKPEGLWDESSGKAHYRDRGEGQPFFAVFNFTTTHESQIRKRPHEAVHDPAGVRVPLYHPDRPEVRQDWAQYYDKMTEMDGQVGEVLGELEEAGLAGDTIVFYYGDHGSGMPRSKRCAMDSGLRVPLIVYVPPAWRELAGAGYVGGGDSDRMVAFVDLGPTVLSLAGVKPPESMQGQAFLGPHAVQPRKYNYGLRGRMDERPDLVRSVTDGRYVYVRNYYLHRPLGQHVGYMFETPTTRVWKELFDAGELNPAQSRFWLLKEPEELYDLLADPDEVVNLAGSMEHGEVLERMRKANREHLVSIRDVGFLPEGEIHARAGGGSPYSMARDGVSYPMEEVLGVAEVAAGRGLEDMPVLVEALGARDSAVRFWGAMGVLMRGAAGLERAQGEMREALGDESPHVRVVAAEALGRYGEDADLERALDVLLVCADAERSGAYVAVSALNALDALGTKAASRRSQILAVPVMDSRAVQRAREYPGRLVEWLRAKR
jgi:uncharacterized sulfatase